MMYKNGRTEDGLEWQVRHEYVAMILEGILEEIDRW